MRCSVCKLESDAVELFEGISGSEMVMICSACSKKEGIPVIRKPSEEQLKKGNRHYSVRERMEKLSGMRDATEVSEEQTVIQGNIAKLRIPGKKETHDDVMDDYYWTVNMARRRKKLSVGQLAEAMNIDEDLILSIEKGKIPENFEEVFRKFEDYFGVKLLKNRTKKINFVRTVDEEREILKEVEEKMMDSSTEEEDSILIKKKKLDKLSRGEIDFSEKESLADLTLNDLVEMKRRREKEEAKKKTKIQTDAMVGDDIDLDLEEL